MFYSLTPFPQNASSTGMSSHHHHHHRRVVDYCSENDDDDAEEVEFSIEEELKELSSLIETSLADAFGFACANDLEASAKTDGDDDEATKRLSADLRLILTPLSSSSQKEEQKRACERCVSTLWRILREQSCGWDKPCYRECFVLSSLRLSVCELSGKKENEADDAEDSQKAMECLDTALILGCPGGMARPFVRCVEKFMRRTEKKRASGDDNDDGSDNNNNTNNNSKKQKVSQETLVVENVLPSSVPKIIHPLERMNDDATWEEFKAMYFNKDLPVQLPSDKSMPCIERWRDVAYFKERFGKRLIPLEVGKYDDVENWKEEIISMEKFIDEHLAPDILKKEGNTFVSYLAQHQLFEQIPQLAMDFEIPKWCNAGRFERCNIWLGTSGTITPCHFDSYDNIFGQVVGYKFVRLFLESDSPFLYQSGGQWETTRSWNVNDNDNEENDENTTKRESKKKFRNAQGNISRVDVESPDLEKYPEFAKATPMDVVLGPGDFIYIPSRTWHYVRSLTASCSLNFLF